MADEDQVSDNSADGEEEEPTTKGKKKLLIIIILLLVLAGVGAGLFFGGVIGGGKEGGDEHAEESHDDGHGDKHGEVKLDEHGNPIAAGPVYHELPEFLVNLSTTGKKVSFLKMQVILEFETDAIKQKAIAQEPRILDAVNTYLRELRQSDLQGSAGLYRLREELMLRINKVLEPDQVKEILFKNFITQ